MTSPSGNQRGAALPLAILVIVVLFIGAATGFMRVSSERRSTANQEGEIDAFALAQAGLSRYMAFASAPPAATLDTAITGLPGGTDSIFVRRIRAAGAGLPALYIVSSSGVSTAAKRFDALTPAARRTVAQFAVWQPGTMSVLSAWTSITGLHKNGGSGTISGTDQCGVSPPVAGVAVPTTAVNGNPGYDQNGGSSVPSGSPAIAYPAAIADSFAPKVKIDWNGIVYGGAITPNYSLTSTAGWPSSFTSWPTIKVTASSLGLGPGNSGSGLLIVTGDLTTSGSFSWNGVILTGGTLTSNGNNTIQGAVVSGLNVQLGMAVPTGDVGNGNKTIQYNSCNVSAALAGLGSLVPIRNAWADNWPAY